MNRLIIIWSIAAAAVLTAVVVMALRQTPPPAPPNTGPDVEALLQKALLRLRADSTALLPETHRAIRAATVALDTHPLDSAEAFYVQAMQHQREQNFAQAEHFYLRAIQEDPEWSWPYAGLGGLLSRKLFGRNDEAIEMLQKAIELDPEWSRPHNLLAVVYRLEDRLDEALEEARYALRLDPENIVSHNNYANVLVSQGLYEMAMQHYHAAININSDHPKPYYNLACLHSLLGEEEDALYYLREAFQRADELRGAAANEDDFDGMRSSPAFQELVYRIPIPTENAAPEETGTEGKQEVLESEEPPMEAPAEEADPSAETTASVDEDKGEEKKKE